MESTLVSDGADANSSRGALFGGDDSELFGPPPTVNDGSKANLMGQLLGDSAEKVSSVPPPSEVVTSKLSSSGLLGSSSSGGLFGDDSGGGGEGGGGLFDEVDIESKARVQQAAAAKAEEELRQRREAEAAAAQQQQQNNVSLDQVDVMHELNLNDNNGDFMGMGMGLGGDIPVAPVPAAQQAQYQQYPYNPQQQQQQQPQQGVMNAMAGSYMYSTTGAGQMTGQPAQTPAAATRNPHTSPQPSILAGMHVGHDVNLGGVAPSPANMTKYHAGLANNFPAAPSAITNYAPAVPFDPIYGRIIVNDPMLIQGSGLFAGPPHWTYLVTVHSKRNSNNQQSAPQPPLSAVRRRFRHFVALEDRLRSSVPGAILPPRPDKHPARAIEEATARQSSEFAQQRSQELGAYMNALAHHPHAGRSPELKLFLTLQDHIGTAWPEVSSSAFTRMTAVGSATVEKLTESVDGVLSELGTAQQVAAGEDSAEVLALAAYEGRRIGAVSSSVPKVEGAVGLIRDRGDRLGATGLETSKLAKDVAWCDRDLAAPMEILAGAMLRSGRRTKRLGLELGAAVAPFVVQYRTCKYEQMAFADRRTALKRRTEARTKADGRAAKLMMNQTSMQSTGRLGILERMETEAAMYDEMATEAAKEAEDVATRLQEEVGRIGAVRVREWDSSMKVIASGMKEACAENAAIWESALEAFKREFPDCPGTGV